MTNDDVEKTLDRLPKAAPSPALGARISESIGEVTPVRALLPPAVRAGVATLLGIAVAGGIAWVAGVRPMDGAQWAIFALLAATAGGGAWIAMRMAVPGEAPPPALRAAFLLVPVLLAALVILLVGTRGGVGPGSCLRHGLLGAVVPWLVSVILLARGFPTAPVVTGGIGGMVAGLWGVSMLHLTCPMTTGPHLMLWHGGVLVVSAIVGAVTGRVAFGRGAGRMGR